MSNDIAALVNRYDQPTPVSSSVEETTKALEDISKKNGTIIYKLKALINNNQNGRQRSKNPHTGRSDSNDSKRQTERGIKGSVGEGTPASGLVYGTPLTREEFRRSYENHDPRKLSPRDKIIVFHSGTIDVNSFDGYTPDDLTQQFGYILGESPTDASTFALRKSAGNKPRFVYETEITNGDFLSHDKPPTKAQLKKIGVVNGVEFTSWNGQGSLFDAIAKTFFGDWEVVDF